MRKSMQERGKWTHGVPRQEEGEPAPKQPRWYEQRIAGADLAQGEKTPTPAPIPAPEAAAADDPEEGPPPLEGSPTDEGTQCHTQASQFWLGLDMMHQCWMESRKRLLIISVSSCCVTLSVFWVFVGTWNCR